MPPRPPLANTAKCEINWTLAGGAKATNIFYVLLSHNPILADLTTLTNIFQSHLTTPAANNWVTALGTQAHLVSWTAIDNSGATEAYYTNSVSVTGTAGTQNLPANCAMGVSWSIAARYRGGKPRWYIPGLCYPLLDPTNTNNFLASFITTQQTAFNGWLASVNTDITMTGGQTVGTISYYTGHALRPTPLFRPFLTGVIHPRVDTQRRRLGKEIGVL